MSLARALAEACVTMLAVVATLACVWAIDPQIGSGVLAVVLCLSLARSHLERDLRGRIEAAIALPVVGLAAVGVGVLLHRAPWLGAALFVGAMFVSIWLRRFGDNAQRLGSLIALPLVALLVTPHVPAGAGPVPAVLMPVLIGWVALFWVGALQLLARRLGLVPAQRADPRIHAAARAPAIAQAPAPAPVPAQAPAPGPATAPVPANAAATAGRERGLRPIASTRMAIQMAVALALSCVIGYVFFAERWAWIVLTAFIVMSGNRGRLDVAYKSVLRVAGAAAGTLLAMTFSARFGTHDAATVALILGAVFLGVWLRPIGYAWWALCVTVALALLQGFFGAPSMAILLPRLAEIMIGASISVATAWWLLPVRSSDVLRRRIADALAALSEALESGTLTIAQASTQSGEDGAADAASRGRAADAFIAVLAAVDQMAPSFRAARSISGRSSVGQAAGWIDALRACSPPARALIDAREAPAPASEPVRRALGAARKAMRDPAAIAGALRALERALSGAR